MQCREGEIGDVGCDALNVRSFGELGMEAAEQLQVPHEVAALPEYAGGEEADGFIGYRDSEKLGDEGGEFVEKGANMVLQKPFKFGGGLGEFAGEEDLLGRAL